MTKESSNPSDGQHPLEQQSLVWLLIKCFAIVLHIAMLVAPVVQMFRVPTARETRRRTEKLEWNMRDFDQRQIERKADLIK